MAEHKEMDAWRQKATKELKGRPLESLWWHTPEGITVKPVYTWEDLEGLDFTNTLPGLPPYSAGTDGDDVCEPTLDDPSVCRVCHSQRIQ